MGGYEIKQIILDDIDPNNLRPTNIRLGYFAKIPFRIRTGKIFSFTQHLGGKFQIFFRNKVEIDKEWDYFNFMRGRRDWKSEICSDVLVIIGTPYIDEKYFKEYGETGDKSLLSENKVIPTTNWFKYNRCLNQSLIAYYTMLQQQQPENMRDYIGPGSFSLFNLTTLLSDTICVLVIICSEDHVIEEGNVNEFFEIAEKSGTISSAMYGPLDDLNVKNFSDIENVFEKQKSCFYPESNLLANIYGSEQSYYEAIMWQVVSLENVIGIYLKQKLGEREDVLEKQRVISSAFTKLGLYELLKIIPIIWKKDFESVDSSEFEKCLKGITIRNEIVHHVEAKDGKVKHRTREISEIREALDSIRNVTHLFIETLGGLGGQAGKGEKG